MQKPAQKRMLQEFVKQFTSEQIYHDLEVVKKNFYEIPKDLKDLLVGVEHDYFSAGDYLGQIDRNRFIPSVSLLNRLFKVTNNYAIISDESAWLFVCGRDVLMRGIKKMGVTEGVVIVCNPAKEVLGYGIITDKHGAAIKHIWDIGDFLRRER